MSIIPSTEDVVLGDLAGAVLAAAEITIRRARMEPGCAWKLDPGSRTLYLNHEWSAAALTARLPRAMARVRALADEDVRPTLRVLSGVVTDPTAPVRPALRVLPGGAR